MGIYIRKEPARYWLVESHREGKKVIQKRLKYLGTTEPTSEEFLRLKEEYQKRLPVRRRRQQKENKK